MSPGSQRSLTRRDPGAGTHVSTYNNNIDVCMYGVSFLPIVPFS